MSKKSVKKLFRSKDDSVFFGVCGGLGEYFDIDPIIIRILFLISFLAWGFSFWIYIILILLIPKKGSGREGVEVNEEGLEEFAKDVEFRVKDFVGEVKDGKNEGVNNTRIFAGIIIIIFGSILLIQQFVPIPFFSFDFFFPLVIILIGLYLIFKSNKKSK